MSLSKWAAALDKAVVGRVQKDVSLGGLSTFRIGGPASVVLHPASEGDVVEALCLANRSGIRWMVLGLGSNILFADDGFEGLVIRPGRELSELSNVTSRPSRWSVGAGLPTPLLARRTAKAGWDGMHRLVGVPGSVGGGVAMNAGAHGQDFSKVVRSVMVVTSTGVVETRLAHQIEWEYRNANLGAVVVVGCELELTEADPVGLEADLVALLKRRRAGTPFDKPCCGSVFRNPAAAPQGPDGTVMTAGQLIEAAGLKGRQRGGAQVSTKHANYIVNIDGARSADVLALIQDVKARILEVFQVDLELEVKVIPWGGDG